MNPARVVAIVLIAAGALSLAYGGFSDTRQIHEVKVGPVELSLSERRTVNVPVWTGLGAVLAGGALLVFGGRKG